MTPKSRTTTGVLSMLVLLPVFAGLLACMPEMAPIGNPELSDDEYNKGPIEKQVYAVP